LSKQFLAIMRKTGIGNESADTGGQRQLSRLSFHALRASFNSGLHNRGVDQELRRKLTGHKSDIVNDRYTRTEMQTLRDAVNKLPALKLN
jgi:integrase